MSKKQLIVAWVILIFLFCVRDVSFAESKNRYYYSKDCMVYQDQIETQDENGNIEVENPYLENIKVKIKRINALRTSRRFFTEKGEPISLEFGNPEIKIPEDALPLKVGAKWGEPEMLKREDNMYCFYVEKMEDVTVLAGTFKDCYKIVYRTLPDDTRWWFCPNMGIVKIESHHHGTITNWLSELKEQCKE